MAITEIRHKVYEPAPSEKHEQCSYCSTLAQKEVDISWFPTRKTFFGLPKMANLKKAFLCGPHFITLQMVLDLMELHG